MLDALDTTLKTLLERSLPSELASVVDIRFDTPDGDFAPLNEKKTVDLFLYDVRENRELRCNEPIVQRNDDGSLSQQRPPVRVDCSYLITAWSPADDAKVRVKEEHQLLGEVMKVMLRYPTLPFAILPASLQNQENTRTSLLQPSQLQSIAEFWQALGGKPKAALNYTATIWLEIEEMRATAPLASDRSIQFSPDVAGR
jgi:Pvc16 N-terminal domain